MLLNEMSGLLGKKRLYQKKGLPENTLPPVGTGYLYMITLKRIHDGQDPGIYIGQTTRSLGSRFREHMLSSNHRATELLKKTISGGNSDYNKSNYNAIAAEVYYRRIFDKKTKTEAEDVTTRESFGLTSLHALTLAEGLLIERRSQGFQERADYSEIDPFLLDYRKRRSLNSKEEKQEVGITGNKATKFSKIVSAYIFLKYETAWHNSYSTGGLVVSNSIERIKNSKGEKLGIDLLYNLIRTVSQTTASDEEILDILGKTFKIQSSPTLRTLFNDKISGSQRADRALEFLLIGDLKKIPQNLSDMKKEIEKIRNNLKESSILLNDEGLLNDFLGKKPSSWSKKELESNVIKEIEKAQKEFTNIISKVMKNMF